MDTTRTTDEVIRPLAVAENPFDAEEKREELAKLAQEKLEAYAAKMRRLELEREKRAEKAKAKRRKANRAAKIARRKNRK